MGDVSFCRLYKNGAYVEAIDRDTLGEKYGYRLFLTSSSYGWDYFGAWRETHRLDPAAITSGYYLTPEQILQLIDIY